MHYYSRRFWHGETVVVVVVVVAAAAVVVVAAAAAAAVAAAAAEGRHRLHYYRTEEWVRTWEELAYHRGIRRLTHPCLHWKVSWCRISAKIEKIILKPITIYSYILHIICVCVCVCVCVYTRARIVQTKYCTVIKVRKFFSCYLAVPERDTKDMYKYITIILLYYYSVIILLSQ